MDQKMRLMEEMLLKSKGWPSLIVQLGGILSDLEDVKDWHTVNEGIAPGPELGKSIKEMTYRFLPNKLKPFFLYLGMFPDKFQILASDLYRWWAAEGMITARDGRSAENLAESYMYELVNRGMVQVVGVNVKTRRIEMVMLHHSMREVFQEEARKDNFLKVVSSDDTRAYSHDDGSGGRDHSPSWSYSTTIRRLRQLAFHIDKEPHENHVEKFPYLRSLLLFNPSPGKILKVKRWIKRISSNHSSVRVLSLDGAVGKLPKEIGNFTLLRVLSLKGCVFEGKYKLPPTIGNLKCLQTLDLRARCKLPMIIPNFFPRLKQLIHLCFPKKHSAPRFQKYQLDGLIYLERLKNLDLHQCCRDQVFQKLNELRRISIIPNILRTREFSNLMSLLAIQTIQAGGLNKPLNFCVSGEVFSQGADILSGCKSLDRLLIKGKTSAEVQSLKSLGYLSSLLLIDTELYEDPMPVLGKLPKLKDLALSMAYSGQDMVCSSTNDFPQLTHLSILFLKNLKQWIVKEGALPNLDHLWIDECDKLTTIRGSFPNLTRLILEDLPRLEEGTVVERMPEHTRVIMKECHLKRRQGDSQTVKFLPSSPCEDYQDESCAGGNHGEQEISID